MTNRSYSPRRGTVVAASLAVAALTLTSCGGEAEGSDSAESFANMKPVNLKVATLFGPDNYATKAAEDYTDAVTEATEGKVTFEYFYAGSLLPQAEMAQGLSDGTIDFAEFAPAYTPSEYPVDGWSTKLAFMSDSSPIMGANQAKSASLELGFGEPALQEELAKENIFGLIPKYQSIQSYDMLCEEPVQSLEDIKGKRIRVGGEVQAAEVAYLGGTAVSLPSAEGFTALQQGVVDCVTGGAGEIDGLGLVDAAKHYTALGLTGWNSAALGMNKDTWDQLPQIAQQALWDTLPTYIRAQSERANEALYGFFSEAGNAGVKFHEPDAAVVAKINEYHAQVKTDQAGNAPSTVADPAATIAGHEESHAKWKEILTGELNYSDEAATWAEYVEQNESVTEDMGPWVDRVTTEIFDKYSPFAGK